MANESLLEHRRVIRCCGCGGFRRVRWWQSDMGAACRHAKRCAEKRGLQFNGFEVYGRGEFVYGRNPTLGIMTTRRSRYGIYR